METELTVDDSLRKLAWPRAIQRIIKENKPFDPKLFLREDHSDKVLELRQYLRSKANCLYVSLSATCQIRHINLALLLELDKSCKKRLNEFYYPNSKLRDGVILATLLKKIKAQPNRRIIVIDNCQHFGIAYLFKVIGLVNELEGAASFIFILQQDYLKAWEAKRKEYPELNYFMKLIDRIYALQ